MTRELQKSDEVSTAEHAECTETEFQSPQEDESNHTDFSEKLLHPSVRPLHIPNYNKTNPYTVLHNTVLVW